MNTKQHILSLLLATVLALPVQAAQTAMVQTAAFRLDLRPSPRIVEAGASETLEYSARWADSSHPAASVKIALDGVDFATLPGDEGSLDWTPDRGGLFSFTHTALDGSGQPVGAAYTASFLVENFAFAPGDVTAAPCQAVYDGAGHGITVSCAVAGATVTYAATENGPFGADPLLFTNAVENAEEWYVVEAPFYQTVTNHAAVVISKCPLTVTAESKSKVYGTANPALAYTATGAVAGESPLSGALAREAGEAVGSYAIVQGTLAANANYTISFTGATFTITKATLPGGGEEPGGGTVPQGGVSKFDTSAVYDGLGHTLDTNALVTAFSSAMGDGVAVQYALGANGVADETTWAADAHAFTNAGEYAVWYRVANPNFEDFVHEAKVTITKRPVSVAADAKTKVYGEADPELTYAVDGLVSGESLAGALAREAGDAVGSYAIGRGTLAANDNYDLTFTGATFTITKATMPGTGAIAWGVAAEAATFLYDGAEHGVALTGLPAGVTATYEGSSAIDAGNYTAIAHLVYDTANYEPIADPAPLGWSITRRPITLMAASKEKPYDGWPLEVKAEDITVAGSGYAPGECFLYGDFASLTDVGEIPATFSYADSATAKVANYDVTVQGGQTLKVTVGGDQISVTADSATWVYDGETHRKPSWTLFNGDKLLEGHVFDIAIAADSAVTTPAEGAVSNRFDHVRIVDEETGRDMTRNYNLFVYEGELRVTNAPIGPNMALHRTVEAVYDGQEHSAAAEAPALLTPATVRYRVGDGDWTAEAPSWTHAGTYTAEFEVSAQFYAPATGTVQVAISPRPVPLASPPKSKPYDATALTFGAEEIEASLTSGAPGGRALPGGESFVYSDFASITDAGRIAATFAWAAGAGTLAADYAVTVVPGTLTVNSSAEEIVVTAKDGTWVFDGAAHTLHEWTAENLDALVAGDALEVAFDPASEITDPGTAENAITGVRVLRDGADVTANYTLSWWPGTLTVTSASMAATMALHQADLAGEAVYDGQGHSVTVAAPALLTEPVTVAYAATADGPWAAEPVAFTDAGAWTAFVRIEAPHYAPWVGTTTMTIAPREVTLVSAGATKVYDGTALRKNEVTVKAGSLPFVASEGFSATCSGTITDVGGVENVFDYALAANTKADNYTIRKEYGWLRVTPAAMDLSVLAASLSWQGPYDGEPHGLGSETPYPRAIVTYALVSGNEEAYGPESPTWIDVSTNTVYFKVMAPNYDPGYGSATVTIEPKTITADMVVLTDDVFFFDGMEKKPSVTVRDGEPSICTEDDYSLVYGTTTSAGLVPVTVTGRNNYTGTLTKEFAILKRPVAPPVIGAKAYNGRRQTATVPSDARWTVVRNEGGVDAGDYEVVLRLTNTEDYRWKGGSEEDANGTFTFTIRKANNGWSRLPAIADWTAGETPSAPSMGQPRYGSTSRVEYRVRGSEPETGSETVPSRAGLYTARFIVDESANYAGTFRDVDFEILGNGSGIDYTVTTPEPVPYSWLDPYLAEFGNGDYEAAGNAMGRNGCRLWESYVAGLVPTDPKSRFVAQISVGPGGLPIVTWRPDLRDAEIPRVYTVYGKVSLGDKDWTPVTTENKAQMRFFQVRVALP